MVIVIAISSEDSAIRLSICNVQYIDIIPADDLQLPCLKLTSLNLTVFVQPNIG